MPRKQKKEDTQPTSRLVLFEPKRNSEYEYTFLVNLTLEDIDKLVELAESTDPDKYGVVAKLGGALYENDNGTLSGKAYVRDDEDEAPKRTRTKSKRRRPEPDEDDEEDEEPPTKARKSRTRRRLS